MNLTENQEPFIIFPALLLALFLLVVIDRIGAIRNTTDDDEEEV